VRGWAEAFIARRDAARRFLAAQGLAPQLLTPPDARASSLTAWTVPPLRAPVGDTELIELAREYGFDG
jgi:hypothetical protein